MWWWLLFGLAAAAVVITITVAYLNRKRAKEVLRNNRLVKATISKIMKDGSVTRIKMDAIKDDGEEATVDITADDYDSSEIREGVVIYS